MEKHLYKGLVGVLCWIGWITGVMAILFGSLIVSGNATPEATGDCIMLTSIAAISYLSAGTLVLIKHA